MSNLAPILLGGAASAAWASWELSRRLRVPVGERVVRTDSSWTREVLRRLPVAWEEAELRSWRGEMPVLSAVPVPITFGAEWTLRTHGALTVGALRDKLPAIESSLNSRRPLVAASEVVRGAHEGWATLRLWHTDPLLADNTVPWTPGQVPARWGDPACLGRFRDGTEVLVPFWIDEGNGAVHTLYSGKNGSGKTRWMLLMADHVAQLGGLIFIFDPVKGIDDKTWKPLHPLMAGGWSDMESGTKGIEQLSRIVRARPGWAPGGANPFVMLLADELNDMATDKAGVKVLREAVSSWRSKGASVQGAAQLPETVVMEAPVRTNFRRRLAGALDNKGEYGAALGGQAPADDDRIPPPEQGGAGQGFYDPDGRGPRRWRGWNASDEWRAEHYRVLAQRA